MGDAKTSGGGIGFLGLLCIAFIILKLCKVIDWSWWWVLVPMWGPLSLIGVVLLVVGILAVVVKLKENR